MHPSVVCPRAWGATTGETEPRTLQRPGHGHFVCAGLVAAYSVPLEAINASISPKDMSNASDTIDPLQGVCSRPLLVPFSVESLEACGDAQNCVMVLLCHHGVEPTPSSATFASNHVPVGSSSLFQTALWGHTRGVGPPWHRCPKTLQRLKQN